ncbi:uncharacterized protein LOC122377004, partial [Amphibalanus amphitrite]|uniref:uncharacterized protein LOC122377004 n=1 Tax=Amphibalanus amphitrite TaxID=1232801 RepID=UPI001C91F751
MHIIRIGVIVLLCNSFPVVEAAGKLQVRLVSFSNPESRALGGACCQPTARAEQSSCSGECNTFFRVCASTGSGGRDSGGFDANGRRVRSPGIKLTRLPSRRFNRTRLHPIVPPPEVLSHWLEETEHVKSSSGDKLAENLPYRKQEQGELSVKGEEEDQEEIEEGTETQEDNEEKEERIDKAPPDAAVPVDDRSYASTDSPTLERELPPDPPAATKSEHSAGSSSDGDVTVKSATIQIVRQATPFSVVSPPARDAIQNRRGELPPTEDVSLSPDSELSEQENGFISPDRPIIILDNPGSTDDAEDVADETQLSSRMTVSHESKYDNNPQDIGFHFVEHGDLVHLQFASFHPSPPGAGSGGSSTRTGASVEVDSVGGGGEVGKKEHGSREGACCNERQKREAHKVTPNAEDDAVSADADAEVLPQSGETTQPKNHGDQPDSDTLHSEDTAGWTLSSPSWEFIGPETSTDPPSSPDDTTDQGPPDVTAPSVRPAAPPVTPVAPPVRPAARRDPPSSRLGPARLGPARRGAPERRWRRPQLPCSLGLLVTGVVANSSLVNQHNRVLEMTFPFDGAWPGELDLTIEAWHDTTGKLFSERPTTADKPVARPRIISRTVVRRPLAPAPGWSRDRVRQGHVQLEYDVRLVCDPNPASRGADCMTEGT